MLKAKIFWISKLKKLVLRNVIPWDFKYNYTVFKWQNFTTHLCYRFATSEFIHWKVNGTMTNKIMYLTKNFKLKSKLNLKTKFFWSNDIFYKKPITAIGEHKPKTWFLTVLNTLYSTTVVKATTKYKTLYISSRIKEKTICAISEVKTT